ncbi:PPOX class F420-dependent oxidoreductase [Lentzea sp. NPDC003310]|uniref:PPOX class F420-dependent oxidoreductase n=1 Tax=Lentzea sp. NPDC003310 TaxID=3154447 RepID=UPI0033BF9D70
MTSLDQLAKSSTVSLTTFRRDGTPVATPVGGVVSGDALYVLSYAGTGKLKRLRNNPRVVVAPCDNAGRIPADGRSIEGTARVLDREETERAYRLMARRTPLARLAKAWYTIRRRQDPWVGVEVTF